MTALEDFLRLMFVTYLGYVGYEKYLEVCATPHTRKCWVRDEYQGRDVDGFFQRTFKAIKKRNPHEFFKATKMTVQSFDALLEMLEGPLSKHSVRKPIEPECRLALTLFYLSNGDTRRQLADIFKMGVSTVASIIFDTCKIICTELSQHYLTGSVRVDWEKYAQDYDTMWNLPNCVGALSARHIPSGTRYFNYKGEKSIVLLAAANAQNNFTAIDIITSSDDEKKDEEMSESGLGTLLNAEYALPESRLLENSDIFFPYYFVGEVSYPLKRSLIRPYPGNKLCEEREHFNARLALARRSVENAFGVMCGRWRVLSNEFNCTPKNFEKIVTACVVLHNFLQEHKDPLYCPPEYADRIVDDQLVEGLWRRDVKTLFPYRPACSNNASREAFALRDQLCSHLYKNRDRIILPPKPMPSTSRFDLSQRQTIEFVQPSSSQIIGQPLSTQIHEGKKILINSDGNLVICANEADIGQINAATIVHEEEQSDKPQYANLTTVQDINIKEYKPITFKADQNGILTAAQPLNTFNVSANAEIVNGQVVSIAEININLT